MKKGVQDFQRKFVLAPTDKDANNVVISWWMYYINILKQELGSAKTYTYNLLGEMPVVDRYQCHMLDVYIDEDHDKLPT